jgi:hypothetical protein
MESLCVQMSHFTSQHNYIDIVLNVFVANNIADITAKATSQTIAVSLIGTTLGISVCGVVGQSVPAAFAAYSVFSAIHLYSSMRYVGVRLL